MIQEVDIGNRKQAFLGNKRNIYSHTQQSSVLSTNSSLVNIQS